MITANSMSGARPHPSLHGLLRVIDELHVDDNVFLRVDLEVDHVARMQAPAEVGTFDLEHHLHRAHEALDGVMVEGQPACARGNRLDDALAAEYSRRGHLLSRSVAGDKPEGQRECESRESFHAPPLDGHTLQNLYPRANLRKRQFAANAKSLEERRAERRARAP